MFSTKMHIDSLRLGELKNNVIMQQYLLFYLGEVGVAFLWPACNWIDRRHQSHQQRLVNTISYTAGNAVDLNYKQGDR